MSKSRESRPPGRPRGFAENDALDAAMSVFAAKGYQSTSLTDLESATGVNRVSLYAVFGNKEALFVKALTRYTEVGGARFLPHLERSSGRDSIEAILRESVDLFTDPHGHGTCFVTQAPLSDAAVSDQTRQFAAERRSGIERMLRRRLQQSVDDGELAPDISAVDLARFYAATILGLALQAQHGATRADLMRVVDVTMMAWRP